jgi:hypothetical protein
MGKSDRRPSESEGTSGLLRRLEPGHGTFFDAFTGADRIGAYPGKRPLKGCQNRSTGLMGRTAWILVFVIISCEVAVMLWLPKTMAAQEVWGIEVARQRTIRLLDQQRSRIRRWKFTSDADSREEMTVALVSQELDDVAQYLRNHGKYLNWRQNDEIFEDLSMYQTLLDKLEPGTLYPDAEELDVDGPLRTLLEE